MERQKPQPTLEDLTFDQKTAITNFMLQTDIQKFHNSHLQDDRLMPFLELRYLVTVDPSLKPCDSTERETARKFVYNAWMRWPKKGHQLLDFETTVEFLFDQVTGVHKHTRSAKWQGTKLSVPVDWTDLIHKLNNSQNSEEIQTKLQETQEQLTRTLEKCARLEAQANNLDEEEHNDGYNNGKQQKEKKHRYTLPELMGFDDTEIQILYKMLVQGLSAESTAAQIKIPLAQAEAIFNSAQTKFKLFLEDKIHEIDSKKFIARATCKVKTEPIASS